MKFLSWTQGWKTYAACALSIAVGAAEYFGWTPPSWATWALAGFGGIAVRQAIANQSKVSTATLIALVRDVLAEVTVPDPNTDVTGARPVLVPVEVHQLAPVQAPK